MSLQRVRVALTWFVGAVFLAFGVAEVAVRLLADAPIDPDAIAFWSISLLGGGALVLLGAFRVGGQSGRGLGMLGVGVLLGSIATMWTLVLPLVAAATFLLWATSGESRSDL